jgi:hypothetical protein
MHHIYDGFAGQRAAVQHTNADSAIATKKRIHACTLLLLLLLTSGQRCADLH